MWNLRTTLTIVCCLISILAIGKKVKVSKDSILIKSPSRILIGNRELVISKDTVIYAPDSIEIVILKSKRSIKKLPQQNEILRHLNAWIFAGKPDTSQVNVSRQDYLSRYDGRIVRKITFINIDVFGASVAQGKENRKLSLIEQTGNRIHRNTRERVLRNSLNMREGQAITPYELSEKEVIIRNLPYVSDVLITPIEVANTDSVDLNVAVQDLWSLGFHWEPYTPKRGFFEIYDENAFGYGHETMLRTRYNTLRSPSVGYEASYTVNNIAREIVRIKGSFANYFDFKEVAFDVQKDYYFKSNYAYGLTLQRNTRSIKLYQLDTSANVRTIHNEVWLGRSIFSDKSQCFDVAHPQIYVAGRVSRYSYSGNRFVSERFNNSLHSSTALLASVALSRQWYNQTKLLLGYGRTEDVPSGYNLELLGGYEVGEFLSRPYFSAKTSRGGIFSGGYLSAYAEIGGYVKGDSIQQGVYKSGIFYYSNLLRLGLYRFRQLISIDYTHGFNRFDGIGESLSLTNNEGIRGYDGYAARAKKKMSARFETIAYSPHALWNFKAAFFAYTDLAWLNTVSNNPFKGPLYSGVGIGVRIRNENLAFKTFSIRLGFYPKVPPGGNVDIFDLSGSERLRMNGFKPKKPDFVQLQAPF